MKTDKNGAPDYIWLQLHGDADPTDYNQPADCKSGDVTWCWEPIYAHDVKYVRVSEPDFEHELCR